MWLQWLSLSNTFRKVFPEKGLFVCYFPVMQTTLHCGADGGILGNLSPGIYVFVGSEEGCYGCCFPLEDTVAPGLHVVLSWSCNSKASQKAKPLVCIKASIVRLLSRREMKQVKHESCGIVFQGSLFVFSFKNKQRYSSIWILL